VTTKGGAVFLDRDNTIIRDSGYLHDPDQVVLLPGAAEGLGAMAAAGWPLVVVSNQSGIARGLFGPEAFHAVMQRIETLLAPQGVCFLASYFCPHHPEFGGPCECRKPGVLLFRQAAADHGLVLGESWFVGDRWRDVEPAVTLGGRGILVAGDPLAGDAQEASRHAIRTVPDLVSAARLIGRRG
jgi:histidinol-phosphate phosphatase family protein